jgi:succinate-semialdehyde dehydrogenase/glutarate-semialdehyde dehydrogenase
MIRREMGKPLDQALGEIDCSAAIYRLLLRTRDEFLADEPIDVANGEGTAIVRSGSVGVLLGIMPELPQLPGRAFGRAEPLAGQHHCALARPSARNRCLPCNRSSLAPIPGGAYVNVCASIEQVATVSVDPPANFGIFSLVWCPIGGRLADGRAREPSCCAIRGWRLDPTTFVRRSRTSHRSRRW